MELNPDVLLGGRYRLERQLGEGGMGVVWSAVDTTNGDHVAIKFLKGPAADSPTMHKRFAREARAAMAVNHPNVVRIHQVTSADDGSPMMVMDFLRGESLEDRRHRVKTFPVGEFASIFQCVVSAVGTAHAVGVVHRDLKPDNIFLVAMPDGRTDVRVLDFGIAKLTATEGEAAATAHLTATGAMMGTPYYMSPEQVFGEKSIDHRSDVWSLGVILYECLCGRKPFDGENFGQLFRAISMGSLTPLESLAPEIPRDVADLCTRMLKRERKDRLGDLREVYEVFAKYTGSTVKAFAAPSVLLTASESKQMIAEAFADTAVPVSQTNADDTPRAAPSRRTRYGMIATTLVAGSLVGAFFLSRPGNLNAPAMTFGASVVPAASSAPLRLATLDPWPSSVPSASASAADGGVRPPVASGRPAAPGSSVAGAKSAASTPPVASSAPKKPPGGLATVTPF